MARRNLFASHNPVMSDKVLDSSMAKTGGPIIYQGSMTVQGAINKTFLLFAILLATSLAGFVNPSPLVVYGGAIGGLVLVIIASFRKEWSPFLAPMYAALEGLFVGGVTAMYAATYEGIVLNAIGLTFACLFLMLFLYKMEIIKVTQKFRSGVIMATGAIFVVYLLNFVLSFFGMNIPYLHEGGMIGIGISLFVIAIASLNLLLDFDFFEKGEQRGLPDYMEWFAGMGLIITLVWLYIEILWLLARLRE